MSNEQSFDGDGFDWLIGRRIMRVEGAVAPDDAPMNTGGYLLTCDDGTQLLTYENEGCGGCGNGWSDLPDLSLLANHDKNGREIYESDILRVTTGEDGESYIATVKWFGDEDYPAFDLEGIPAAWNYDANALATIFNSGVETCEVIGNVFEGKTTN